MQSITFLSDSVMTGHRADSVHPERPSRLHTLFKWLEKDRSLSYSTKDDTSSQEVVSLLGSVHDRNLVRMLESSQSRKQTLFDFDTIANNRTYASALKAVGLTVSAARRATSSHSFFSLVRPPGHHATSGRMTGFCFVNNIAVAAHSLVSRNRRVAIIDFDFHYGNGTADLFWDNPNVLYISVHADPNINFPYQGFLDEVGGGEGRGFNACVPLFFGSSDRELVASFDEVVLPLLDSFSPSIVGVSAGFDGYVVDPVGEGYLQYTPTGFQAVGQLLFDYSRAHQVPLFHTLEGGYNITELPNLVGSYIQPWVGQPNDSLLPSVRRKPVRGKERRTIRAVRQMLSQYWSL